MTLYVRFLNRVSSGQATHTPPLRYEVMTHRWSAQCGPDTADIVTTGSENSRWALANMLLYGIEIYNELGDTVWWGYISGLKNSVGAMETGYGLDDMSNRIAVAYTIINPITGKTSERRTTAYAQHDDSILLYGAKELLIGRALHSDEEANAYRDLLLSQIGMPVPVIDINPRRAQTRQHMNENDSGEKATILCRGWMDTLDWKLFSWPAIGASYMSLPFGIPAPSITEKSSPQYPTPDTVAEDQTFQFGDVSTAQKIRFGFKITGTKPLQLKSIRLKCAKIGAPTDDLVCDCYSDSAGSLGVLMGSATLANANIAATAQTWTNEISFAAAKVWLVPGAQYHIQIRRSGALDAAKYYRVSSNSALGYPDGASFIWNGSAWVSTNAGGSINPLAAGDIYFQLVAETGEASFDLNGIATHQRIATSFQIGGSQQAAIGQMTAVLTRVGNPSGTVVGYLCADSAGAPGGVIDSVAIDCSAIPDTASKIVFTLPNYVLNNAATTLWFQLYPTYAADGANYIRVMLDSTASCAYGEVKTYTGSAWNAISPGASMWFEIDAVQETTTQIANVVNSCGQFIIGLDVEINSGIWTNPYRAGNQTGLRCILDMLDAGSASGSRLLATIDRDRRMRVYAEPALGAQDYYLTDEARLESPAGILQPRDTAIVGVWARLRKEQLPPLDTLTPFAVFIEAAEYRAGQEGITPIARSTEGAYDLVTVK